MNLQRLIEQYISYQRSLGSLFRGDAFILRAFGRARGPRASVAGVRVRHVEAFLGKARPVTRTWFIKLSCLRSFFRYAVSRGYVTMVPLPTTMPKHPPVFVPYIYTREELRRLLQVIETHPPGTHPGTGNDPYDDPGVLWGRLTLAGSNQPDLRRRRFERSVLMIRNTKFGKTRLVPVGPQLSRALVQYDRTRPKGRPTEAPFFATGRAALSPPWRLELRFRLAVRSRRHPSE